LCIISIRPQDLRPVAIPISPSLRSRAAGSEDGDCDMPTDGLILLRSAALVLISPYAQAGGAA
jgi:hypothetical protein